MRKNLKKGTTMIEQINEVNFQSVIKNNKIVVVDFFAPWCGPCSMMHPIVEECAKKYTNIKFVKVDIDANTNLAISQNIQAVPTFIAYKNGAEVARTLGYSNMQNFQFFLEKI